MKGEDKNSWKFACSRHISCKILPQILWNWKYDINELCIVTRNKTISFFLQVIHKVLSLWFEEINKNMSFASLHGILWSYFLCQCMSWGVLYNFWMLKRSELLTIFHIIIIKDISTIYCMRIWESPLTKRM